MNLKPSHNSWHLLELHEGSHCWIYLFWTWAASMYFHQHKIPKISPLVNAFWKWNWRLFSQFPASFSRKKHFYTHDIYTWTSCNIFTGYNDSLKNFACRLYFVIYSSPLRPSKCCSLIPVMRKQRDVDYSNVFSDMVVKFNISMFCIFAKISY